MTQMTLSLRNPDFTTALRIAQVINARLNSAAAFAKDPSSVVLTVPEQYAGDLVSLMADVENLRVSPDQIARVVVDETSGVIVMGANVRISTVAIAQGNLTIRITETPQVSQRTAYCLWEMAWVVAVPDEPAPTDEDEGSCGARSSERKQDGGDTGTERAEAGAAGGGKSGGARPEGSSGGACGASASTASEVGTRDSREPWLWEERWTDTPYAWAALMACHCFAYAIATASVFPHGYAHVAQGVRSVFTAALGAAMALQTAVYVSDPGVITPNEDVDPAVRAFVAHSLDSGDRYYTWRGSGGGNDGADKMGAGEGGGGVEPPLPSECANFRRDASGDIVRCVRGRDGAVEVHKYCAACNVWRPPHAAHCRDCNVCVRRLDHHWSILPTRSSPTLLTSESRFMYKAAV